MAGRPERGQEPYEETEWTDEDLGVRGKPAPPDRPEGVVQVNTEDDLQVGGGSEPAVESGHDAAISPARRLMSTVLQALVALVLLAAFALGADLLVQWLYAPDLPTRLIAVAVGLLVAVGVVRMAFGWMQLGIR